MLDGNLEDNMLWKCRATSLPSCVHETPLCAQWWHFRELACLSWGGGVEVAPLSFLCDAYKAWQGGAVCVSHQVGAIVGVWSERY